MLIGIDWRIQFIIIGQVAVAMVLGGPIGFERELANKPAGFRTHTLVAGAAALFMAVATTAPNYLHSHGTVEVDPLRVAAAIVTGVSFLGAGTIFRSDAGGGKIGGLTTAATIWLSAAVGMAVSLGQLIVAIGVTLIALLVLRGLSRLDRHYRQRNQR
ncbi:MAG: MgtC/SapB family protein [Burkholderiaceae bacterium]|nr:MgtC/SapB family protein [Burkholderiaceae bacterium]